MEKEIPEGNMQVMVMATSCTGEPWPTWCWCPGRQHCKPSCDFSLCWQLRGENLSVYFSPKGRGGKVQLSLLFLLAEWDQIRGQECHCWVGYSCFQWDNPHHFRAFEGSTSTCKYTWVLSSEGWWEAAVAYTIPKPLLTFIYFSCIFSFSLKGYFELKLEVKNKGLASGACSNVSLWTSYSHA